MESRINRLLKNLIVAVTFRILPTQCWRFYIFEEFSMQKFSFLDIYVLLQLKDYTYMVHILLKWLLLCLSC